MSTTVALIIKDENGDVNTHLTLDVNDVREITVDIQALTGINPVVSEDNVIFTMNDECLGKTLNLLMSKGVLNVSLG